MQQDTDKKRGRGRPRKPEELQKVLVTLRLDRVVMGRITAGTIANRTSRSGWISNLIMAQ